MVSAFTEQSTRRASAATKRRMTSSQLHTADRVMLVIASHCVDDDTLAQLTSFTRS